MTLTHSFDLTGVLGPVIMSYLTWYDIEQDFDYVYVEASSDGQHWEILTTPSGTAYDLSIKDMSLEALRQWPTTADFKPKP